MKFIDITGQVFGRLTVIERFIVDKKTQSKWLCACECGINCVVSGYNLRKGLSKSCGCLRKEMGGMNKTHNMTNSKEYRTWRNMINRCYNKKVKCFSRYGAIGITVCDQWKTSFETFFSDMGKCPDNFTIDRINPNAGYSPENCKWASTYEQNVNKRNTVFATINGVTKPVRTWCYELGMNYRMVRARIADYGWSPEDSILTPKHGKHIK